MISAFQGNRPITSGSKLPRRFVSLMEFVARTAEEG